VKRLVTATIVLGWYTLAYCGFFVFGMPGAITTGKVVALVTLEKYATDHARFRRVDNGVELRLDYSIGMIGPPRIFVSEDPASLTGGWPLEGAGVVVVTTRTDRVYLFARQLGDCWQIWAPNRALGPNFFSWNPQMGPPERGVFQGCLNAGDDSESIDYCLVSDEIMWSWLR